MKENIRYTVGAKENEYFTWTMEVGIPNSRYMSQTWDFDHQMRIP